MDIKNIEIDTVMLKADVREIESGISDARNALNALMSELNDLNSKWSGRANMAFRAEAAKDHELMAKMITDVEKLKESMDRAAKEYEKCENEVKGVADSIRI